MLVVSGVDVLSHSCWLRLSLGVQLGSWLFSGSSQQATSGLILLKSSSALLPGQYSSQLAKHPLPGKLEVGKD